MPVTTDPRKIDDLMERASRALASTAYFEAERMAAKALHMARERRDFDRMARIVLPLQEARRQRYQQALDRETVTILDEPFGEEPDLEPGCYLVRPPLVGADARQLRLAAHAADTPVAVLCREPTTQTGLCPIVAVSPGATVRVRIRPPRQPEAPDLPWFVDAMEALGDAALEATESVADVVRRVDALLMRLDAVPEHERLHQALEEACRDSPRGESERRE